MKTLKDMSRAGVTLVELLVVILIVTILAVTMLPMFQKYVTKAQYAAEPIPLVGHIKTQVDLYLYEHSCVPGETNTVYTWVANDTEGFKATTYPLVAKPTTKDADDTKPHFAGPVELNTSDLMGKRIAPDHVFYACINPGKSVQSRADPAAAGVGGDYGYAIGVFGNAAGLPKNTGYAVMELMLSSISIGSTIIETGVDDEGKVETDTRDETGFKLVGTWENYTGNGAGTGAQILFGSSTSKDDKGLCQIPDADALKTINDPAKSIQEVVAWVKAYNTNGCGLWTFPDLEGINTKKE